ncbi:SDR family NAD(P)-dependent oxidoreductase [Desulfatitalea alkaliphila]|uniref:SDR family NAD(P)-dependent oxidoreductase n=1 Tax=Desulfatitalea alkaliphila TaxID=2929485 RepID=A0AA41UHY1_9BACT|nr:SDR family NAD(P)-dependent oxidoreductase [Desulfatitalea alkaliphila]MCJ8499484.1 SDR family NAD(P)-dependent oxidoreductase [Desulfatitalea alkaliphila]
MIGITAYGAYLPKLRLQRAAIFQSMGWFAPALMMVAQGERAMCNWDEDAVTMAVAAARDCLTGRDKQALQGLYLASTSLPFADRQNAGIVATALNLPGTLLTADVTASQKAGSTALLTALETVQGGARNNILVAAADRRETRPGYFYEMWFGDGAAALQVGDSDVIAAFEGAFSVSYDFVDHYRAADKRFDYFWEERWVRDEGYGKMIPEAVNGLLAKLGIAIDQVDRLVYPCFFTAEHRNIAKKLGARPDQVMDNMHEVCGETGAAHSLLLLVRALETAEPGQRILMAGFGQGCNALCFRVTEAIAGLAPRAGVRGALARGKATDNYAKWLKFRELIDPEMGIRAEAPTQTAMTTLWRNRKMLLGLVGGRCRTCGTPQFPKMDICVNPDCGALHSQEDYEFADRPARIKTFTGDLLAVSVDPPHKYGMVQFDDGGRLMADFTDCDFEELQVGLPVQMVFRKRTEDKQRGFVNYFWKATPTPDAAEQMRRIRFDDRVAIVTGAGGGLGRAYALELARRGAKVVVNDLGGARDGSGAASAAADRVVAEIREAGGQAVANYDNVAGAEGGAAIVQTALDAFGRVDILINNAGILRDKSFVKMEAENWRAVMDVHLNGAYNVTRPAFAAMKANGFGRIVMTSSAAGLYGNFGQANYSAAKMALVGLMNTLKLEGGKYDIRVNTIAPLAASRLTEDVMPPELFAMAKPDDVVPMVLYLCSEGCDHSGQIFNAGVGHFSRAALLTGPPVQLGREGDPPAVEDIAFHWDHINDLQGAKELADLNAATVDLMTPPPPKDRPATTGGGQTPAAEEAPDTQAIFDRLAGTFKADAAEGVDVVFQFLISGPGGGNWSCEIKDRQCTVAAGDHPRPTCTLKMAAADFGAMMTGRMAPMQAFTSGKLKIEGDVMKSQLIEKLFTI